MKTFRKPLVLAACAMGSLALSAIAADTGTTAGAAKDNLAPGERVAMRPMGTAIDAAAVTTTFTVQDVDKANRIVTLKASDGSIEKFKCGPEVRNFDQIKQGDQVRATVVDELAVAIRPGDQGVTGAGQMVALSPKGAKPGAVMIQTHQVTAKVLAVDPDKRMVSLEGPSGMDRTIKVSPRVDLSQIKKGDNVTVQVAQGLAISVQSPQEPAEAAGATLPPADTTQPDMQQKGTQP